MSTDNQGEIPHSNVESHNLLNPSKLKLAQATGGFYKKMLDLCITPQPDEQRNTEVESALDTLPHGMKSLYRKGVELFKEELDENRKKIERWHFPTDDYKIRQILRIKLRDNDYGDREKEFFAALEGRDITY